MGLVEDYPDIKDWLVGKNICSVDDLDEFLDKFHASELVRSVAYEYRERFCEEERLVVKPKRYHFKSPRSKARLVGIDKKGRRYAVGRSGYRISTKGYERYFRKLAKS